jgi:hypothetical protein
MTHPPARVGRLRLAEDSEPTERLVTLLAGGFLLAVFAYIQYEVWHPHRRRVRTLRSEPSVARVAILAVLAVVGLVLLVCAAMVLARSFSLGGA